MAQPVVSHRPPTRSDIDALPAGMKGEIINGVFYAMTRPRSRHQATAASIVSVVFPSFHKGRGGPGGWWILPEPGIELPGTPEIAPDIAGWHRERVSSLPSGPITFVPDWVCEILSPSTRRHNLSVKMPYYASIGVPHAWVVDLDGQVLQAYALSQGHWLQLTTLTDEKAARIPPFDSIEIDVSEWWIKDAAVDQL